MAVLRLPGRGEGAERRRDVAGPHVDVPRRVPPARPRRGPDHRDRGTGADRRPGDQAADRAVPAHAAVRHPVLGRSDLGHRVDRRHGRGRAHARHPHVVPVPAHPLQPGACPGTEPHRAVERRSARGVQALLRGGLDRHVGDPVRERRAGPPPVRRRRRDRLLRVGDARGQADAVLRRPRQPREDAALRDQRRARRGQRRAGGPAHDAGVGRRARLRRCAASLLHAAELAGRDLRRRAQLHPLHARQVRLRAPGDGASRPQRATHDGVRHRRPVGRGRLAVRDPVRAGQAGARRARARGRLCHRGRVPDLRQRRRPGRRHRGRAGPRDDAQPAQAADVPRRGADAVGTDDHLERGLRQGDRQHAGRPPRRAAVRTRAPTR